MKNILKTKLSEELNAKLLENFVSEDYPSTFDIEEFKTLNSYSKRVKYCDEHLFKISSGSSRIVYAVDSTKVLKLAKNEKGVAQCNVEIQWGNEYYFGDILAKTLDSHPDGLWVEMELALNAKKADFKKLEGFDFDYLNGYLRNVSETLKGRRPIFGVDPKVLEIMENNEFVTQLVDLMVSANMAAGDLARISSYGKVKRDGVEKLVLIDFGLTHKVYSDYYDRSKK